MSVARQCVLESGGKATARVAGEAVLRREDVSDAGVLEDGFGQEAGIVIASVADHICAAVEVKDHVYRLWFG